MKTQLVSRLRCVNCGGKDLRLTVDTEPDFGVSEGRLICSSCSSLFEIRQGVPLLHPQLLRLGFSQADMSASGAAEGQAMNPCDSTKLAEWSYYDML